MASGGASYFLLFFRSSRVFMIRFRALSSMHLYYVSTTLHSVPFVFQIPLLSIPIPIHHFFFSIDRGMMMTIAMLAITGSLFGYCCFRITMGRASRTCCLSFSIMHPFVFFLCLLSFSTYSLILIMPSGQAHQVLTNFGFHLCVCGPFAHGEPYRFARPEVQRASILRIQFRAGPQCQATERNEAALDGFQ